MAVEVATWADGFGNWHARVTEPNVSLMGAAADCARDAIADELALRGTSARALGNLGVKLVELRRQESGKGRVTFVSEYVETWPTDGTEKEGWPEDTATI